MISFYIKKTMQTCKTDNMYFIPDLVDLVISSNDQFQINAFLTTSLGYILWSLPCHLLFSTSVLTEETSDLFHSLSFWDELSSSLRGTLGFVVLWCWCFFNVVNKISTCGVAVISFWSLCFSSCGVWWNEFICGAGVFCFTFLKPKSNKFSMYTSLIHAHLWQTHTTEVNNICNKIQTNTV